MKSDIEELRKKYINNPPEGMTSENIRSVSADDGYSCAMKSHFRKFGNQMS